jgi:hypothetical protein
MAFRDNVRTFWKTITFQRDRTPRPTSLQRFPSALLNPPMLMKARKGSTLTHADFDVNRGRDFIPIDEYEAEQERKVKLQTNPSPPSTTNGGMQIIGKGKQFSISDPRSAPSLAGGRQSTPTNYNPIGLSGYSFIYRREYQDLDLSNIPIGQYDAIELLELLADLSPDVSRAIWNVLRVAGTGVKFQVVNKLGEDDPVGQKMVDGIVGRLNFSSGGIRNVIIQLLMSAYLQGAIALDIAPTPKLDDIEDFYPVNPVTIYFQRDDNQVPVPFQRQPLFWGSVIAPFRRMNTNLFFYTPIDPSTDDVYGRPPTAPALQMVFFQTQVYRDLQRVIHQQGWPKIDISVVTEIIKANMPLDVQQDEQRYQDWIRARLNEVIDAYNSMEPEDAYVHPDFIQVSSDNAKAGNGLFNVEGLLQAIRSQLISALKMLPIVMGESAGATETFATVELAIFSKTVETLRDPVGEILCEGLEVALQLMGHAAVVKSSWQPIQVLSRMQIALAVAQEMTNLVYQRNQGWITQDQASKAITGSAAIEQIPPIYTMTPPLPMPPAPKEPAPDNGPIPPHVKNANTST